MPMSVCSHYQSMSTSVAPKSLKKKLITINYLLLISSQIQEFCQHALRLRTCYFTPLRHASCSRTECRLCPLPLPLAEQKAWLRRSILNLRHPNSTVINTQSHCLLSLSKGSFICGDDFSVVTRGKKKEKKKKEGQNLLFIACRAKRRTPPLAGRVMCTNGCVHPNAWTK